MKEFMKFFSALWIVISIFAIGWAILPFILANALDLSWINWFGFLTVPSGLLTIIIVLMQRGMVKKSNDLFDSF
jgi:hypothetical protein